MKYCLLAFIDHVVYLLNKEFKFYDSGALKVFLIMEVNYKSNGIILSQQECIVNILQKANMVNCKLLRSIMATPPIMSCELGSPSGDS